MFFRSSILHALLDILNAHALTLPDYAAAFGAVLLATTLKAFAGFGFGLAVVPLLSLVMPPVVAVPLALALDLLSAMQLAPKARHDADWNSLKRLVPAALLAIAPGIWVLAIIHPEALRIGISAILLITVALMASGAQLPLGLPKAATFGIGATAGALSGAVGMPGPPVMIYFLARPITAATKRASLLMFFIFTDIGTLALGAMTGLTTIDTLIVALSLIPALMIGNFIGHRLFGLASEQQYRAIALALLTVIGLVAFADVVLH